MNGDTTRALDKSQERQGILILGLAAFFFSLFALAGKAVSHEIGAPQMVLIRSVIMLPVLTVYFNFLGILGGYFVGVNYLGIPPGPFVSSIVNLTDYDDLTSGLIKSCFFGLILSFISCYKGYTATKGAAGVGMATTQAVVLSSVLILVSDYFLTDWLF